ncbi:MAG: substrate-binding periplasmic protein [Planctomycetota bacterium]|jgi:ABC-type amino acid transport substrate-binding protein
MARILALIIGIVLTGCSRPVRVATDAVFPPFHFIDDDGRVVGHDVELALLALERAGERAVIVHVDSYAALADGLRAGRHDLVAATTGITPARQRLYAFSRPYFVTCLAVVVRRGTGEPTSIEDLAAARIGASRGTTSVGAADALSSEPVVESTGAEAIAALRGGRVAAIVMDEFEAVELASDDPALAVLPTPAARESYAFVLRLADTDLRDRIDGALASLEADGTMGDLRRRHGLDRPPGWPLRIAD